MKLSDIRDYEVSDGADILYAHQVNPQTREGVMENLLWCIMSQATTWEQASKSIFDLRRACHSGNGIDPLNTYLTMDFMQDLDTVNYYVRQSGFRFHHENRLDGAIRYLSSLPDDSWIEEVVSADSSLRDEYVSRMKGVAQKTFSFWHLCLGGTSLIALDVHVLRGLSQLGLDIPEKYYVPQKRERDVSNVLVQERSFEFFGAQESFEVVEGNSQSVRASPKGKEYDHIEGDALKLFSQDGRFFLDSVLGPGSVDAALVDAVLWWRGARRAGQNVDYLFESFSQNSMPYGDLTPFNASA